MSTSSRGRGGYRGNNSGGGGSRGNYPVMRYPPRPYYGNDQNRGWFYRYYIYLVTIIVIVFL